MLSLEAWLSRRQPVTTGQHTSPYRKGQDPGRGCKVPEPHESRSSKLLASPSLSHVCWWKVSLLPGADS